MANPSDLFRPDGRKPRLPVDALARGRPDTAMLINGTWLSRVWLPPLPNNILSDQESFDRQPPPSIIARLKDGS